MLLSHREEFSPKQNRENAREVKRRLEALRDIIPGIVSLSVRIDGLKPESDKDLAILGLFDSRESLAAYQVHPAHLKEAEFVRSVMRDRTCFDYPATRDDAGA